jgi:hypothetical protein
MYGLMRGNWKPMTAIVLSRCEHQKDQKRLQQGASSLLYPSDVGCPLRMDKRCLFLYASETIIFHQRIEGSSCFFCKTETIAIFQHNHGLIGGYRQLVFGSNGGRGMSLSSFRLLWSLRMLICHLVADSTGSASFFCHSIFIVCLSFLQLG